MAKIESRQRKFHRKLSDLAGETAVKVVCIIVILLVFFCVCQLLSLPSFTISLLLHRNGCKLRTYNKTKTTYKILCKIWHQSQNMQMQIYQIYAQLTKSWNSLPNSGKTTCLSSILRREFLIAYMDTSAGIASSSLGVMLGSHEWQTRSSSLNTSRPNISFEIKPNASTDLSDNNTNT